jgi:hypothetical protein
MDKIIEGYMSVPFGELNYCYKNDIMYQRDMHISIEYDKHYFAKYVSHENSEIARKLNQGRTSITEKYCLKILDIGIGSGEFIKKSNIFTYGYDINPVAIKWLMERQIYVDPYTNMPEVDGLTFWDSLEHIPNPGQLLSLIPSGKYVFISLPIFNDLLKVRSSKHYKPNEHYYYFTANGMIGWMKDSGFDLLEMSDFETRAGREDILTFVFKKN